MPHGVLSFLFMTTVQVPNGITLTECLETSLLPFLGCPHREPEPDEKAGWPPPVLRKQTRWAWGSE